MTTLAASFAGTGGERKMRCSGICRRSSDRVFFGISALLFAVSAGVTIAWCGSMPGMDGMPMPGGWTMSMTWMRMPGQSWCGAAASFVGMWGVMMIAMMLPSLVPMLWRYRQTIGRTPHVDQLTALAGAGYFLVWILLGIPVFPLGVAFAKLAMDSPMVARAVPIASGLVILAAGALQFSRWKRRHLACCRETPACDCSTPADAGAALRHGLRLGIHCCYCCGGLTAILLVAGIMDLRAMAVTTAAITLERLAPAGECAARVIGYLIVGVGLLLMARATGLG